MNIPRKYWDSLSELVNTVEIIIDRPKWSSHPRYPQLRYPLDYGYLANTRSNDGNGVDVWLGSEKTRQLTGIVCTVDTEKRDVEVKLLLGCTTEDIDQIVEIHNTGPQIAFFIKNSNQLELHTQS